MRGCRQVSERISVADIRRIGQPESITGRRTAEHWSASLYLRHWSPYLTWLLLPTGISANGVTVLMMLVGWGSAFALLIPGLPGAFLAALMAQGQMLVDASDGEVARVRGTTGPTGVFLDKIGHYTTEALIPLALGIRAAGEFDLGSGWSYAGAVLAIIILWNKALNDMLEATRYSAGLPKLVDSDSVSAPQGGMAASLRKAVRFFPFHRIYHSVEMTLLILAAGVLDLVFGDLVATRWLLALLIPLSLLATLGHAVAIVRSQRLK
ncbi:MAG: transferase [Micrococcales bacterium]|nr:transferase [Micrococcales bacterium]